MLTVPPSALSELVPLPCKSVRKLFKKDCRAAVPFELAVLELVVAPEVVAPAWDPVPLELPPVKALTKVLNAVLSWDKVLEDKPEEPVEELSS